jgi:hypothetical protein
VVECVVLLLRKRTHVQISTRTPATFTDNFRGFQKSGYVVWNNASKLDHFLQHPLHSLFTRLLDSLLWSRRYCHYYPTLRYCRPIDWAALPSVMNSIYIHVVYSATLSQLYKLYIVRLGTYLYVGGSSYTRSKSEIPLFVSRDRGIAKINIQSWKIAFGRRIKPRNIPNLKQEFRAFYCNIRYELISYLFS